MSEFEQRVYDLVKEQFGKMKMSKKYSNQARLEERCQDIIYNQWGIGNDNIWRMVNTHIKTFIPDHMD